MKTLFISIVTAIAFMSFASSACADLSDIGVTSMYTDSETQFRLFLSGGEINQNASNSQQFSDDEWMININVNLAGAQLDSVHVTGTAWHVKPPDNSGFGPIVRFDVMIGETDDDDLIKFNVINGRRGEQIKNSLSGEFSAEHSIGGDYYTFASTVDRDDRGIFGWTMVIEGLHHPSTPAPGALALLGIAGFVGRRRCRR